MEQNNHNTYIQEETIDLRELFAVLKRRKKFIGSVTALFMLLALAYVLIATPWWEVNVTLEIGKYKDTKSNKEVYLENGSSVAESLKITYIDVFKHAKNRDSKIQSINTSKKNPQFITITALGKSNELALSQIQQVIDALQNKHQKIIDEIIATKQSQLDQIDRDILQINQNKIPEIEEKINYLQDVKLKAIEQKITTVKSDLEKSLKQKDEATQNLSSLKNEASLAALRLAQIQGLEYKISAKKLKLIDLDTEKKYIISSELPSLKRDLKSLRNIDLAALKENRKLIVLSMQPHNYHNTAIIGKIITQDKAVKPKKLLILIAAFITGLMLSVFLAFFMEFLQGSKEK
jgi:capsular polysaccharide biosynthesis protein